MIDGMADFRRIWSPIRRRCAAMEARVAAIRAGDARPSWSGCWSTRRSTPPAPAPRPSDLLQPDRFPVYRDRPRRAIHLSRPGPARRLCHAGSEGSAARDVRRFVRDLEEWMIRTLARFNVTRRAARGPGRHLGARSDGREDKIAAIGVRVRRWVTLSRHRDQRRSGPRATSAASCRAASTSRAARRHLAGAARPHRLDAGVRHGAARGVRGSV